MHIRSFATAMAVLGLSFSARADEEEQTPLADENMIPVVVEAGSDVLRLDDELCIRRSCMMRIRHGHHQLDRLGGCPWFC